MQVNYISAMPDTSTHTADREHDADRLVKVHEVATFLGVSHDTVLRWARSGWRAFPDVINMGRNTMRFRLSEIQRWVEAQREAR